MEELINLLNEAARAADRVAELTLSNREALEYEVLGDKIREKITELDGKVIYEP